MSGERTTVVHLYSLLLFSNKKGQAVDSQSKQMDYKCNLISEKNPIPQATYYIILFIEHSKDGKAIGTKTRLVFSTKEKHRRTLG